MKITAQNHGGLGAFALVPFTRSLDVDALPGNAQAEARALVDAARRGDAPAYLALVERWYNLMGAELRGRRLVIEDGDVSHTIFAPDSGADPAFIALWNWVQQHRG